MCESVLLDVETFEFMEMQKTTTLSSDSCISKLMQYSSLISIGSGLNGYQPHSLIMFRSQVLRIRFCIKIRHSLYLKPGTIVKAGSRVWEKTKHCQMLGPVNLLCVDCRYGVVCHSSSLVMKIHLLGREMTLWYIFIRWSPRFMANYSIDFPSNDL